MGTSTFLVAVALVINVQILSGKPLNCVQEPYDMFLVIDGSISIEEKDFDKVKTFLRELIDQLDISSTMTHVGLLQFSVDAKVEHNLTDSQNKSAILKKINGMKYQNGDGTRTDLGLSAAFKKMYNQSGVNRPNVTDLIIVFTDGASTKKGETVKEAKKFHEKKAKVFAIGAAGDLATISTTFRKELKKIASKDDYVIEAKFENINKIIKPLLNKVGCDHVKTSPPTTPMPSTTPMPRTISTARPPDCERDILFIVDGSANTHMDRLKKNKHFEEIKGFIGKVISGLDEDKFKIGVMQFGGKSEPTMEVDFTNNANIRMLMSALKKMKQHDGRERRMGEALEMASRELYEMNAIHDRYNAQDIIVLITRGKISDEDKAKSEIKMLHQRNVLFITIAVGSRPQYLKKYLVDIFSPQYANVSKYKGLKDNVHNVLDQICLRKKVEVEKNTTTCGTKPYDIFFVIDGSASIHLKNFNKVRRFLMDSLTLLRKGISSNISIGFMQFSETIKTKILLELGKHSIKEELNLVQGMEYQSGEKTMLGDALSRVNDKIFTGKNGDRPYAENIMILLTDGIAHDIEKAYDEAKKMKIKKNGVRVVTIAAGTNVSVKNLEKIASRKEDLLEVQYSDFSEFAEKAISVVCNSSPKQQ